jgi:tRNA(Ile)-lysidine synthase
VKQLRVSHSKPILFAKRGLYETFHRTLAPLKWNRKGEEVLLGLSGGRDSVVLLHLLLVSGAKVTAAHLNHQLRGKESDRDEKFVRSLCKKWNVLLIVEKENIREKARKHHLSIEESARIARYRFFEKTARKRKLKKVLVAHHQRDQAETILLKIFFGVDRKSLRGMDLERDLPRLTWSKKNNASSSSSSKIKLVRPLLNAPYSEIFTYSKQNKLLFREDRSNKDLSYPRNWVRHHLLPLIEKKLKRNVVKTLARLAR